MKLIEQILAKNNVREALNRVVSNKGASGIDGMKVEELRFDLKPVEKVTKGQLFSMPVPEKVRPSDKIYIWQETPMAKKQCD